MALFSALNVRHRESFPVKNSIGWNPQKFSPVDLSLFTVHIVILPSFKFLTYTVLAYCAHNFMIFG